MQKVLSFRHERVNYNVFRFNGSSSPEREYIGTVKDVGVDEIIQYALRQGANVLVDVSSGNLADALTKGVTRHNTLADKEARIKVVHILSPQYKGSLEALTGGCLVPSYFHGGILWSRSPIDYSIPFEYKEYPNSWLTPEERVKIAKYVIKVIRRDSRFKTKRIVDVTHHIPNEYLKQAEEVLGYRHKGKGLDYLAIPVGTGRVFVSFYRALNNLRIRGESVTTRLIGLVPEGENPIYHTFVRKKGRRLVIENFNPQSIADKLSCPNTDLLPEIMKAKEEGHMIIELDETEIANANRVAYHIGELKLEDSASVGFALTDLEKAVTLDIKKGANIGIFVTGFGMYNPYNPPQWMLDVTHR